MDLADHPQDVFPSALGDFLQQGVRRWEGYNGAEAGGAGSDLGVFEAFPQGAEQPAECTAGLWVLPRLGLQLLGDSFEEFALCDLPSGLRCVRGHGLGVLLRVLGGEPFQHVGRVEREAPIPVLVVLAVLVGPAALGERVADGALVRFFRG